MRGFTILAVVEDRTHPAKVEQPDRDRKILWATVLPPAHCITAVIGRISSSVLVPLACTTTAQELVRVLAYPKFRLSSQD